METNEQNADSPILLPGFGLPLAQASHLPTAVGEWFAQPIAVRERVMIQIMASLKDKPEWERKVFDGEITTKWCNEAIQSNESLLKGPGGTDTQANRIHQTSSLIPTGDPYMFFGKPRQKTISEKMFNHIIEELRKSANESRETGFTAALDANATVYISDTAIDAELQRALRAAVAPLEAIPDKLKDWHPGSDNKVLDIVHPSLFPLVYGRSRILPVRRVPLEDCSRFIGKGETTEELPDTEPHYSDTFQWLPCDVDLRSDGTAKITSYINNLHPKGNEALYAAIEQIIAKSVKLWVASILSTLHIDMLRIPRDVVDDGYIESLSDHEDEEDWDEEANIKIPEPCHIRSPPHLEDEANDIFRHLREKGMQVIVKLANIQLTPDSPWYNGGSWHIEGQLNEHICASALYYYDSDNVTPSYLAFREGVDHNILEESADQNRESGMCEVYGIEDDWEAMQVLGRVLTREGRLLAFPNVLQHCVSPFGLADPTQAGHRKLLALFLVDPWIRIPSTANVPPQQAAWWTKERELSELLGKFPVEIAEQVIERLDFPVHLGEAKRIREDLIDERKQFVEDANEIFRENGYSFCEH